MWYLFLILVISSTLGIPVNNDDTGKRGKSRLLTHILFLFIFNETFKALIVPRLFENFRSKNAFKRGTD